MTIRLRSCAPEQVSSLLPGALAGEYLLAPASVEGPRTANRMLRDGRELSTDAAVVVTTSGSTGQPKGVLLSARAMTAAAEAFRARYGAFTWTLALPAGYVAGLMVLVRGLLDQANGAQPTRLVPADLTGLDAAAGPNAISLVPTQLVRALRSPELSAALAGFDAVLVGGAAVDQQLLAQARAAGIPVLTSYGMSETCGGCVFDGQPLPGVQVDIAATGRISIGGPMLFSGYLDDPAASAAVLGGGRLLTNDRGEWVGRPDGTQQLRVLGRFDDVVISGGVNVDLAAVQRAVDALGRGETAVVGVPDQEWGTRIVLACTTPRDSLADWQAALRSRLAPAALPRQLLVLPQLPRTSSGKPDRQQLRRMAS
ncbi:MAG: AMP-binding protein [Brooklawnia sp.]